MISMDISALYLPVCLSLIAEAEDLSSVCILIYEIGILTGFVESDLSNGLLILFQRHVVGSFLIPDIHFGL